MTDHAGLVAEVVEAFERGEFEAALERHGAESARSKVTMIRGWWPTLDGWIGRSRRVTQTIHVTDDPPTARAVLSGATEEAVVTMIFDEDGKIAQLGVTDWPLLLGIGNLQIDCPEGTVPAVARLYAELLGMPFPDEHGPNWIVLAKDRRTKPALPFAGQAAEWRAPAWGDPDRPQQMHLELFVRDVTEASAIAERDGALRVDDDVWADPAGHAIRLEAGESGDAPAVIGRIVIDCYSPRALAPFYEELLEMVRIDDTSERVVIAHDDGRGPMLAFRRVSEHTAPRWPDPAFPQQMHMDLKFADSFAAKRTAIRLGAVALPPAAPWSHPDVYADPAGHPFCICFPGQ